MTASGVAGHIGLPTSVDHSSLEEFAFAFLLNICATMKSKCCCRKMARTRIPDGQNNTKNRALGFQAG